MKTFTFLSALLAGALGGSLLTAQILAGTAQTHREPQFENDAVKVWKTTVLPNQPLAMHHHDHPRVLVALTGGTMNIVDPAGNIEAHRWEAGKAYWLPAMAPNTLHSDVNAGDKALEVLVVELEKENWSPAH